MTEKIETLHKYLPRLSVEDQVIICAIVNSTSVKYHNVHRGLLPFMPLQHIAYCLAQDWDTPGQALPNESPKGKRRAMAILSKLGWPQHTERSSTFIMHLDDGKVFKRFGRHPERGKVIPGRFIKRKRPRKMFERATDAYDMVPPTMNLVLISKGYWRVTVNPRYEEQCRCWLRDYCR